MTQLCKLNDKADKLVKQDQHAGQMKHLLFLLRNYAVQLNSFEVVFLRPSSVSILI